jgi:NAD-dependent SIR2 family protein deacetylase
VDSVRCLACNALHSRNTVQEQLSLNNVWPLQQAASVRPDGDMEIPDDVIAGIALPRCPACSGDLKPDVVFFGGSVPAGRVQRCYHALEQADALLVIGSSLMVFSGFRFCRRVRQLNKPIAIVNPGLTRADDLAQTRLYAPAGPLLADALRALEP